MLSAKDKVVLITGADTGMGEAALLRFVSEGAWVVAAGRTQATLERAVGKARALGGRAPRCVARP